MARIEVRTRDTWENYHQTLERTSPDWRALAAKPSGGQSAGQHFKVTALALQGLVAQAASEGNSIVSLGSAWSFSNILAGPGLILDTKDAAAIYRVPPSLQAGAGNRRLVLCHGGTTIRNLNGWLLEQGLSLFTSGAHDGQTVAGACGTGTHGSVVGFGAFQNHVRGMQLVTGPETSLWVEKEPFLDHAFVRTFADSISNVADHFDAALVHLGGLGIVNAVLLEVADDFRVAVVRRKAPMTNRWLEMLERGEFRDFAQAVWTEAPAPFPNLDPYYVEVILNPFADVAPFGNLPRPALISLYYRRPVPPGLLVDEGPTLDDVLDLIRPTEDLLSFPWLLAEGVTAAFKSEPRGSNCPKLRSWGKANGKHTRLVDLYNAAYAVPRERLVETIKVMKRAFLSNGRDAAGPLVFTLRFVHKAAGLLAFTPFEDTLVINMDGLREPSSVQSAELVALGLEMAGVSFQQHWGKQGAITFKRFRDGYGDPSNAKTKAGRWRAARNDMLDEAALPVFVNDALRDWKLV